MSLVFYPNSHRYKLDGQWVPGVTTLIGKGLPKPALVYWSAKMVAEFVTHNPDAVEQLRTMGDGPMIAALKAVPWEKRDTAAIRGTEVHDLAEKIAHGGLVEVPEHLTEIVSSYVTFLDLWQPEVIWTERPVASREWRFAGKPDIVCRINGQVWLLDWKTSRDVYGDNATQVAAYGHAEFYVDEEGNEHPMPEIERYGIVHITPGETQLYEVNDHAAAWLDFQHILWVANAADRIKGYLGEPLTAVSA
jgi:hypothetical protein